MSWRNEAKMYARFARDLRQFLKQQLTLEDARKIVRDGVARREENFLSLVERAVYGNPSSPYLALLRRAECEFGDLRDLVTRKGLTLALGELRAAGVYVDFEEFKGRTPIVRNEFELQVESSDFDNPFLTGHFTKESGGSTGAGSRTPQDLDHYAAQAPHQMLARAAHGVLDAPYILWRGILPDGSGMGNVLRSAYYHHGVDRWYSQLRPFATKHIKYTLASYSLPLLGWLNGERLPFPRYVPLERADIVARAIADLLRKHKQCLVGTVVSRAVRICQAAAEHGVELRGTTFLVAGEPLTPAKARAIQGAGARHFTNYGISEGGRFAHGCAHPLDETDVHVARDTVEVFTHSQPVDGFDTSVPVFNLTTLLPTTPKIMLNVQGDDYGILESRSCGCELELLGWCTHLRQIRSYRKLTGEGVTLVGSEMIHILEEVLPQRFGGSSLDYQLLEEEDGRGLTRLYLLVHPRVALEDEQAVLVTLHGALGRASVAADAARETWQQANTIQIKRTAPVWSERGKFSPIMFRHKQEDAATSAPGPLH